MQNFTETLTLQTPNTLLAEHKQTNDFLPRWVLWSSPGQRTTLGTCVMCRPRPASKANIWKRNRILVKPGAELMLFALKTFLKNSPERTPQCWKIPSLFLSLIPRSGPFPQSVPPYLFRTLSLPVCLTEWQSITEIQEEIMRLSWWRQHLIWQRWGDF